MSNRTTVGAGVCADATGAAARPASARATIHFMFATRTHLLTSAQVRAATRASRRESLESPTATPCQVRLTVYRRVRARIVAADRVRVCPCDGAAVELQDRWPRHWIHAKGVVRSGSPGLGTIVTSAVTIVRYPLHAKAQAAWPD